MLVYVLWLVAFAFAYSPYKHTERIHVDCVVVLLFDHLWRHVYRCSYKGVTGETFRFAETQVRQLSPIVLIQLKNKIDRWSSKSINQSIKLYLSTVSLHYKCSSREPCPKLQYVHLNLIGKM